ncbi:MAG: phosphoenolpyruvate-utilizing N-terminal domain-containing protein, partial [Candidatus Saccharicenans sp.]
MAAEFTIEFPLLLGLHARPASFIQEKCQNFPGEIVWENIRTKRQADAKSILSLVTSETLHNDLCRVVVRGKGEKEFAAELKTFLLVELPVKEEEALQVAPPGAAIIPRILLEQQEVYLAGQPASSGMAVGKVAVLGTKVDLPEPEQLRVQKPPKAEKEKASFLQAVLELGQELKRSLAEKAGAEKNILQSHLSIITDPALAKRVVEIIEKEKTTAEAAVLQAAKEFSQELLRSNTQYIRERVADLKDVALRLLEKLGFEAGGEGGIQISEPAIVVAEDLYPSDFLNIGSGLIVGLVLEKAGQTSHTLIMARGRGIPAVTGVAEAGRL